MGWSRVAGDEPDEVTRSSSSPPGLDLVRSIRDDARMGIVDQRAAVPVLDAQVLGRLARALDRDGVAAAVLFGSQARDSAGPLSDIDIGIWYLPDLDPASRLALRLDLDRAATEALRTDEVDVVMLNSASPLMRHRAIRDARLLVDRVPVIRVRLEARAIIDYLDTGPLRAELARGLRHRLEEDRLGRR